MQQSSNTIESLIDELAKIPQHRSKMLSFRAAIRPPASKKYVRVLVERWLLRNIDSIPEDFHSLVKSPVWKTPLDRSGPKLSIDGRWLVLNHYDDVFKGSANYAIESECTAIIQDAVFSKNVSDSEMLRCPATEQNLLAISEIFDPCLDNKCEQLLAEINAVNVEEVRQQFAFPNIPDQAAEFNALSLLNSRIRYGWTVPEHVVDDDSLTAKIAKRPDRIVYADPTRISVSALLEAFVTLDQYPLLLVFDDTHPEQASALLDQVHESFSSLGISDVGIYFRCDSTTKEKINFNNKVKEYRFNVYNTSTTAVVGTTPMQLPKILLKSGWKPRTVLSFTSDFRDNKLFTFADTADLVIYYTLSVPSVIQRTGTIYGIV